MGGYLQINLRHKDYAEGESVTGLFGWQDYAVVDTGAITRKVMETDLPLSLSLGVLGLNGITAYFGLLDNGLPRPGDTVVVSTAAGAVGSAVGQIAKLMGCRTVGIAGGPTKTKLCLDEFGYDVAIDYKVAGSIDEWLAAACPDGVDVYFDSTSGPISDAVMAHLSIGARVVICGRSCRQPPRQSCRLRYRPAAYRVRRQYLIDDRSPSSKSQTAPTR